MYLKDDCSNNNCESNIVYDCYVFCLFTRDDESSKY